jgi:chromosome segregation ATPase
MSETNNQQQESLEKEQIQTTVVDLADNNFYCEKCYDMVNYFISECETLSPKATKFKNSYLKSKNEKIKIKNKYETLQFVYDEVKAQKEDIEERYNLFLKALATKNQLAVSNKPEHNTSTASTSTSTTKISFNMSLLNEKVFGQSLINRDYVYDYFGKIIQGVINESNRRCLPTNEIDSLKKEIESLKKQLVNKEDEFNLKQVKSNEIINSLEMQLIEKNDQIEMITLNKNNEIQQLNNKINELNDMILFSDQVIEGLNCEKSTLLNEKQEQIPRNQDYEIKLNDIIKEKDQLNNEIVELKNRINSLMQEKDSIFNEFHESKTNFQTETASKLEEIQNLKNELDNENNQEEIKIISEYYQKNLEKVIQQHESKLNVITEEKDMVSKELLELIEQVTSISKEKDCYLTEIQSLKSELINKETNLNYLQEEKTNLCDQIQDLINQNKQLNNEFEQNLYEIKQKYEYEQTNNANLIESYEIKLKELTDSIKTNKKSKQRFSEPVYFQQQQHQLEINQSESTLSLTNISNIYLENSELTVNKIDQATSMDCIASLDEQDSTHELLKRVNDLMAQVAILENEKESRSLTSNDDVIIHLREEVLILKQAMDKLRCETNLIVSEYEKSQLVVSQVKDFFTNDFNLIRLSNEQLKQNITLDYEQIKSLKEESNNCLEKINFKYAELETKYFEECERSNCLKNLANDYEAKLNNLNLENQHISDRFEQLQSQIAAITQEKLHLSNQFEMYKNQAKNVIQSLKDELSNNNVKNETTEAQKLSLEQYEVKLQNLLEEKTKVDSQILELQDKLNETIQEKENIFAQFEKLKTELSSKESENVELLNLTENQRQNLQEYETKLLNLTEENEKLNMNINELQSNLNQHLEEKERIFNEYESFKNQTQNLKNNSEILEFQDKLTEIIQEKDQIFAQYEHTKSELNNREIEKNELFNLAESLKLNMQDYETKLVNLKKEKEKIINEFESFRTETENLKNNSQILELQDKLNETIQEKENIFAQFEKLKTELSSKESENVELLNLTENQRQNLQEYETKLLNLTEENEKLNMNINELQSNLNQHLEEKERIFNEYETLKNELTNLSELKIEFETYKSNSQNEIEILKNELTNLSEIKIEFESYKFNSKNEIENLKSEIVNKEDWSEKQISNLNEYKSKLQSLLNEKELVSQEISDLQVRLESNLQEKDQILADFENLKVDIQNLRCQLADQDEQNNQLTLNHTNEMEHLNTVNKQFIDKLTEDYESRLACLIAEKENVCIQITQLENELEKAIKDKENLLIQIESYQNEINSLNEQLSILKQTNANLEAVSSVFIEEKAKQLADQNEKINELTNNLVELKRVNSELNSKLDFVQQENDNLTKMLNQTDESRQIEINNLRTNLEATSDKLSFTQTEILSLKNQLLTEQQEINEKDDEINRISNEIKVLNEQILNFKEIIQEKEQANLDLAQLLETEVAKYSQELFDQQSILNQRQIDYENLKIDYDSKLNELASVISKLNVISDEKEDLTSDIKDYKNELIRINAQFQLEKDDLLKQSSKHESQLNDLVSKCVTLESEKTLRQTELNYLKQQVQILNQEKAELHSHETRLKETLESHQIQLNNLHDDYEKRLNERANELLDTQRKLCAVHIEKDNLVNEMMLNKKQHDANIEQYKEEVNSFKQQLLTLKVKPSVSMNESYIDKRVEASLQNRIDALAEEKAKRMIEIEAYKAEILKLNAQFTIEKENLIKEHEKLKKDQQQAYHSKLKKQALEIKQLNEKLKDHQDTNNFLTNQINNLNKQIYDMDHDKENENKDEKITYVNKPLLEDSLIQDNGMTAGGGSSSNDEPSKYLHAKNQNLRKALDMSSSIHHTPAKSGLTTPSSTTSSNCPMTPSTAQKKQVQCAQQ